MSLNNFDGLLNMLDVLEIEDGVVVRLTVLLKFLRMIIRWGHSWITTTAFSGRVSEVESHVAEAYAEMQRPYETGDCYQMVETLCNLSTNVEGCRDTIWLLCKFYATLDGHYYESFGTAGDGELGADDLLKQLADPLLEIIALMVSWFDHLKIPVDGLQVLLERLTFVRYLLVKCRCSASAEALDRIELVFENALFVCSLVWWSEHEMTPLGTLVADVLAKLKDFDQPLIVLDLSTNQSGIGIEFDALVDAQNLDTYLRNAIDPGNGFALVQAEKDRIEAVLKELWFFQDFLMRTIPHPTDYCSEPGLLKHELTQYLYLAQQVSSALHSLTLKEREHGISEKLNVVINDMLNCINTCKSKARLYFLPQNPAPQFYWTLNSCFVDNFLQKMDELLCSKADLIAPVKRETELLVADVRMVMSLLGSNAQNEGLEQLVERVANLSYKAEYHIDSIAVPGAPQWTHMVWLSDVIDELRLINSEVEEKTSHEEEKVVGLNASFATLALESEVHSPVEEEVVGYDDEVMRIRNRLDRGTRHLDIVSIVGMPGLGKTTLAHKLYKSQAVTSYFHVRSWCCISQVYTKRRLLLDLLDGIVELDGDRSERMSDDDLAELLCRSLKGRRYLIVLDDIWSIDAWEDLRLCFPDQENGSRILLTSRVHDVSLLAKSDSEPIYLRMLSKGESLVLLQKRVFNNRSSPPQLSVIGEKIAEYCRGLPLLVVVVAGILKGVGETVQKWNGVAESMRIQTLDEEKRIMGVLELSYQRLPDHLKPCFLYLSVFPQDREISVKKLVLLWVAEGLVLKTKGRNWEDVAESYLNDLIGRSLVVVAKRKSRGGIKACRLHDLLLYFCFEKAKEENFLLSFFSTDCFKNVPDRISIYAYSEEVIHWRPYNYPNVRSLLFNVIGHQRGLFGFSHGFSFLWLSTKLLRVLDLAQLYMENGFPYGTPLFVHLTYLAVRGRIIEVPTEIMDLWKLETLLVKGMRGEVSVPGNILNMRSLRHLQIRDRADFKSLEEGDDDVFASSNIVSVATPSLCVNDSMLNILAKLPCLRKLRCIFYSLWDVSMGYSLFPALDSLSQLESLKVFCYGKVQYPCGELSFPLNLKKLTLSKFRLPWSHISKIGRMPNLEVLKLLFKSFEGDTWDVNDEEFSSLKFLKLDSLDIAQWNVSLCSDPFPCLEHLVVQSCKKLEGIPLEIGDIPVLEKIEVHFCNREVSESAKIIHDQQLDLGNDELQVHIHPQFLKSS